MKKVCEAAAGLLRGEQSLRICYALVLLLLATILLGTASVRQPSLSPFFNGNVYYWLFSHWEPLACGVWAAFLMILPGPKTAAADKAAVSDKGRDRNADEDAHLRNFARIPVWLMAAGVLALGIAGWFWVLGAYPVSMDEVMAQFQAEIFAQGKVCAPVPREHAATAWALTPVLCTLRADGGPYGSWVSTYLPGWSAMLAPFHYAGADWLLNPLLSALCLPMLLAVGNRIWGRGAVESRLAVLLLACSPQFLTTAMTSYAMPAHLLLSLVWIWLMLRRDWLGWAAAPWVGLVAITLHQPHVHPLLAAPFLLRLVCERRWRVVAYMTASYAVQVPVVVALTEYFHPGQLLGTSGAPLGFDIIQLHLQPMNLLLLITWSNAPLVLLTGVTLVTWRVSGSNVIPPPIRDAALACALTFGIYILMPATQGHGWGYRYFHPALGCWCLVAAAGLRPACALWGHEQTRRFIVAGCVFALAVLLPLRCVEMKRFAAPFIQGYHTLCHESLRLSEPYVATPLDFWYGQDFQRNDPFLRNRPLFLFATRLGKSQAEALRNTNHLDDPDPGDLMHTGLRKIRQSWYP
ncbi:MAG: glycosyltransferase family 87 protein [Candidatus Methylacidiphilales bacterium]